MVAKSFQSYTTVCDAYWKNGKQYIDVKHPKTNKVRSVRWYSEAEYKKLYPDAIVVDETHINHKKILGFSEGYITIFKGVCPGSPTEQMIEYAPQTRYHSWWGWYVVGGDEIPTFDNVEPVTLYWDSIKKEDDELAVRSKAEVMRVIDKLLYQSTESKFIGSIDEKISIYVEVKSVNTYKTQYGHKDEYLMVDQAGNEFVWTTDAGKLLVGESYNLRAKVKEHKVVQNSNRTVVWYCAVLD